MAFLPASRTKRNLFKVASLGLAGLLAGLLAGCNDGPDTSAASTTTPYTHLSGDSLTPDSSIGTRPAPLPTSIEATQIPALKHPPSARRLQYGSAHNVSQVRASYGRNGY